MCPCNYLPLVKQGLSKYHTKCSVNYEVFQFDSQKLTIFSGMCEYQTPLLLIISEGFCIWSYIFLKSFISLVNLYHKSISALLNTKGKGCRSQKLSLCATLSCLVLCPESSTSLGLLVLSAQALQHMVSSGCTWGPPTSATTWRLSHAAIGTILEFISYVSSLSGIIVLCCLMSSVLKMVVSRSHLVLLFLAAGKPGPFTPYL